MSRFISTWLTPVLKWGSVIGATAATTAFIVITAQVYGDGHQNSLNVVPLEQAEVATQSQASQPWSPSAGFADLIERVSPSVVHVATSGVMRANRQRGFRDFGFPPEWEEFFRDFQNPRNRDQSPQGQEAPERSRP
ncbi:MAG: hypothetical protein AAF197_13385, partial [Pseudomonadota bacterium]